MSKPTYNELKRLFQSGETLFVERWGQTPEGQAEAIAALAKSKNDNGWPLGMLAALKPQFALALGHWTAGGYADIRDAQEGRSTKCLAEATCIEECMSLLPLWKKEARHYSKDSNWYERLAAGCLELESFMGCCKPGHTFAYAIDYQAVLVFAKLKTARLVGALTRENGEGEVLLPKGASFEVISIDRPNKAIFLEER